MKRWVKRSKHNGSRRKYHGQIRREKERKLYEPLVQVATDAIVYDFNLDIVNKLYGKETKEEQKN